MTVKDLFNRLDAYRTNYASRDGEDGLVKYLVETFDVPSTCLEVGASDGKTQSNTLYLREKLQWEALLIEPPGKSFDKLKELKEKNSHIHCGFIESAGENSLDSISKKYFAKIGVLSLDIDGNELEIFQKMETRPSIVVIEYNRYFPPHVDYNDPSGTTFFRHSAKAVERVGRTKQYRPVAVTKDNVILLDEALIVPGKENAVPNLPVEALFDYKNDRSKLRLGGLLVGSKQYTTRYLHTEKPTFLTKLANITLTFLALYKQACRRKTHLRFSIPENVARQIKEAGLFV